MNMRKCRVPQQGISNIRLTDSELKKYSKNSWNPIQDYKQKNHSQNYESFDQKPQKHHRKNESKKLSETVEPKRQSKALQKIRRAYKAKTNIWKMSKAWNFADKGYITVDQFKDKIQRISGVSMSSQQVDDTLIRYGNSQGKIDIKSFLQILYGDQNNSTYQPKLFQLSQQDAQRSTKIENLIDKLSIYQHSFLKRQKNASSNDALLHSRNSDGMISATNLMKNKSYAQAGKKREMSLQFSKDHFNRVAQQSFDRYKSSFKSNQLCPSLLINENQSKSRFGATFNPGITDLLSGCCTQKGLNKLDYQQKMKEFSNTQKNEKKIKLFNRIQKIRNFQNIEKQNIQKMQKKEMERQNCRLQRKRLDRQAYQFSSFIKNKWL